MTDRETALAGYAFEVYRDLKARGRVSTVEEALKLVPACLMEDIRAVAVEMGRGLVVKIRDGVKARAVGHLRQAQPLAEHYVDRAFSAVGDVLSDFFGGK